MIIWRLLSHYPGRFATILDYRLYSSQLSYKHNFGDEPLRYTTIGSLFQDTAQTFSHKKAIVSTHQQKSLTFGEALIQADKLAAGFKQLGLEKGDKVGLWAPNVLEWYTTNMACARAGFITVGLNPTFQAPELKYCINKIGIKAIVCADTFKSQDYYQLLATLAPEIKDSDPGKIKSSAVPSLRVVVSLDKDHKRGAFAFDEVLGLATEDGTAKIKKHQSCISPNDPHYIKFTSGSTGKPKAVLLSHVSCANNGYFVGKRLDMKTKDHIICIAMQFFHVGGSVNIAMGLNYGSTLVIPTESFNADKYLNAIQEERCSAMLATPAMIVDLIQRQQNREEHISLDTLVTAGAPCAPELFKKMVNSLKVKKVKSIYGLTETTAVAFQSLTDEDPEKTTSTVGCLSEHFEAKVIDGDGNTVPFGTVGQLCLRGYSTMLGYWNDEDATKNTIDSDGWLRTGDLFILQEDGYGKVVGRLKDMILRGGENIYPLEIEEVLNSHPDILEAYVIGLPHDRLGEEVCACIRVKPGSTITKESVDKFCKDKMAHAKIPSQVRIVDEFPKTTTHKIDKMKLRDEVVNYRTKMEPK